MEWCPDVEEGCQDNNEILMQQLERLWNTDFGNMAVDIKVEESVEDRKALDIVEKSLQIKDGHYQAALPWRKDPPDLLNNKEMARRLH